MEIPWAFNCLRGQSLRVLDKFHDRTLDVCVCWVQIVKPEADQTHSQLVNKVRFPSAIQIVCISNNISTYLHDVMSQWCDLVYKSTNHWDNKWVHPLLRCLLLGFPL